LGKGWSVNVTTPTLLLNPPTAPYWRSRLCYTVASVCRLSLSSSVTFAIEYIGNRNWSPRVVREVAILHDTITRILYGQLLNYYY